jgi:hypothetical protein
MVRGENEPEFLLESHIELNSMTLKVAKFALRPLQLDFQITTRKGGKA